MRAGEGEVAAGVGAGGGGPAGGRTSRAQGPGGQGEGLIALGSVRTRARADEGDDGGAPTAPLLAVLGQGQAPRNPMDAYLASLSPNGRRAMRERLRAVARLIGVEAQPGVSPEDAMRDHWHTLTFERIERLRQELLARGAAPSTVNLTLAALKGIARYARRFGLLAVEDYENIREVAGAKGERPPAGRELLAHELA